MKRPCRLHTVLLAAGFAVLSAFAAAQPAAPGPPRLDDLCAAGLHDLQATIKVTQADEAQMAKISRDFGLVYRLIQRLKDVSVQYKAPGMVRIASRNRLGMVVVNGSTVYYRLGFQEKREKDAAVSKRYSLMDMGMLTQPGLATVMTRYLREERVGDTMVRVFDVRYRGDDSARYVVWVDPVTHVLLKRQWYDAAGKLRATFVFRDVQEPSPGLWVPTRVEIRASDGTLACVTSYTDLKVNQGLEDSLFDVS